jgi:hypothetical protein
VVLLGDTAGTTAPKSVLVAAGNTFNNARLVLPTDRPSRLTLDNRDRGVEHNIAIYAPDPSSPGHTIQEYESPLFRGVATETYTLPSATPGPLHVSLCIHHSMSGVVVAAA